MAGNDPPSSIATSETQRTKTDPDAAVSAHWGPSRFSTISTDHRPTT
jgi:hypothetical protein